MNQPNWVKRRKLREARRADAPSVWRDVCAALTDASRTFNEEYGGESKAAPINGGRFRVTIPGFPEREAEIDFDKQNGEIAARYGQTPLAMKTFTVQADHISVFIVDQDGKRVTPDEVSESILTPSFFPGDSGE